MPARATLIPKMQTSDHKLLSDEAVTSVMFIIFEALVSKLGSHMKALREQHPDAEPLQLEIAGMDIDGRKFGLTFRIDPPDDFAAGFFGSERKRLN